MIQSKKQFVLRGALALALLSLQIPVHAVAQDKLADNAILATGKGFTVTRSNLDDSFITYKASLAARGQPLPEEQRELVQSNLLQHLIISKILLQHATADDKAKTKEQVDMAISAARSNAPTEADFNLQIKATGMTLDQMRQRANKEQLCTRVLNRELKDKISVSSDAIKKFYDDHPNLFEVPEQVRAAHILIATTDPATQQPLSPEQKKEKEKLAREIRARAEKGEDFAKLAKEYSQDPGSKDKGGEYTFPRGQMVPEFEAAAFSLKVNQISDLVETRFGYHIIKLLEKLPPSKVQFADASPRIKDHLQAEEFEKELPDYFKKLEADNDVKLLNPGPASK